MLEMIPIIQFSLGQLNLFKLLVNKKTEHI